MIQCNCNYSTQSKEYILCICLYLNLKLIFFIILLWMTWKWAKKLKCSARSKTTWNISKKNFVDRKLCGREIRFRLVYECECARACVNAVRYSYIIERKFTASLSFYQMILHTKFHVFRRFKCITIIYYF